MDQRIHGTFAAARAGMPVTAPLFCRPCLKHGHECPAREGSDECIFCEDNAPCPVMQRAVTAHTHERPTSTPPRLRSDSLLPAEALNKKRAQPIVTAHAARPKEFLKHGGEELIRAAVKELAVKQLPVARTCSIEGCPVVLKRNNKTGRCTKHYYIPKKGRKSAGGGAYGENPPKKLQRTAAKVAAARNGNGAVEHLAATLIVTEQQLDDMFINWPLDEKVLCIQAWFDREA